MATETLWSLLKTTLPEIRDHIADIQACLYNEYYMTFVHPQLYDGPGVAQTHAFRWNWYKYCMENNLQYLNEDGALDADESQYTVYWDHDPITVFVHKVRPVHPRVWTIEMQTEICAERGACSCGWCNVPVV